jgi:hypothetical protein
MHRYQAVLTPSCPRTIQVIAVFKSMSNDETYMIIEPRSGMIDTKKIFTNTGTWHFDFRSELLGRGGGAIRAALNCRFLQSSIRISRWCGRQ